MSVQVTRSPSTTYVIVSGWSYPELAYASDDKRAFSSVDRAEQGYGGYGFQIPEGSAINKVEIGIEGYIALSGESISVYYSVDGGSTWTLAGSITNTSEALTWFDRTADRAWTPAMLSDTNFRVKIRSTVPAGCFAEDTEVTLWEEDLTKIPQLKKIQDIKPGDEILAWDPRVNDFAKAIVTELKVHEGEFDIYHIICRIPDPLYRFALERAPDRVAHGPFKDIAVTNDHPVITFNRGVIRADEVQVGDYLWGCFGPKHKIQPIPVVEIKRWKANRVYDLQAKFEDGTPCKTFFKHYSMLVEIK
jgi:hypothetical protein